MGQEGSCGSVRTILKALSATGFFTGGGAGLIMKGLGLGTYVCTTPSVWCKHQTGGLEWGRDGAWTQLTPRSLDSPESNQSWTIASRVPGSHLARRSFFSRGVWRMSSWKSSISNDPESDLDSDCSDVMELDVDEQGHGSCSLNKWNVPKGDHLDLKWTDPCQVKPASRVDVNTWHFGSTASRIPAPSRIPICPGISRSRSLSNRREEPASKKRWARTPSRITSPTPNHASSTAPSLQQKKSDCCQESILFFDVDYDQFMNIDHQQPLDVDRSFYETSSKLNSSPSSSIWSGMSVVDLVDVKMGDIPEISTRRSSSNDNTNRSVPLCTIRQRNQHYEPIT